MKKVYLILLLSVLSSLFASSCALTETIFESVSEVELINLQNGEKTVIPGDSEHADIC